MKKKNQNIFFRAGRMFFLIFFLFFLAGNTFFKHAHYVNERIIVHSHPFQADSGGKPTHSHTASEYFLIDFISNFIFYITAALVLIIGIFLFGNKILLNYKKPFFSFFNFSSVSFRGPPAN